MALIRLLNVEKKIKNKYVLENINLDIEEGKIYGFIGHNGCGKTMLFRAICNFINLTAGEIYVKDVKLQPKAFYPVRLGAIIEYPGFIDSYTGIENLEYLADINKYIDKNAILDVMKQVGLYDFKDEKVKKYSLGMRQKLGIVQAIMEDQELLVFDEPTNALDEDSIKIFREIMISKKKQGKTILIASHHKEDLEDLFDYTVKMSNGRIESVIKRCTDEQI